LTKADTRKTAIVTGAANGIGLATVRHFLSDDWSVIGLDRDEAGLASLTADTDPATCATLCGDVARPDDWRRAVSLAQERFGRIDALVNNAGISGPLLGLADYPLEAFDEVMAVNVRGVFLGMQACVPVMQAQGSGAIVNTSSIVGMTGGRHIYAYTASKHAVLGLTKTAAVELAAHGIRVNAVCPSPTATEMMFSLERNLAPADPASVRASFATSSPMGRYGEPEEIAAAIVWLCSPAASFVNGIAMPVDGGMLAR
jgi:3alpha(or 20beta)-hydroxysteroid dehydrogenase